MVAVSMALLACASASAQDDVISGSYRDFCNDRFQSHSMAVMFDSANPTTVILAGVLTDTPNTGCFNFTGGTFTNDPTTGHSTYSANVGLGSVSCGFSASWDGAILHGSCKLWVAPCT